MTGTLAQAAQAGETRAGDGPVRARPRRWVPLLGGGVVALAGWSIFLVRDAGGPGTEILRAALVVVWAGAGTVLAVRRPAERLAPLVLFGSLAGAVATVSGAILRSSDLPTGVDLAEVARPVAVALLPPAGMWLLLGLPDGRLRVRWAPIAATLAISVILGLLLWTDRPAMPLWPVALEAAVMGTIGLVGAYGRYGRSTGVERQRLQWIAWALTVGVEIALVAVALRVLTGWPPLGTAFAVASIPVPACLALGVSAAATRRIDVLLVRTLSVVGLTGVVVSVFFAIVLGLGRAPTDSERTVLVLSMVAAGAVALLWLPARARLTRFANRVVHGDREAADQVLRTFGSRLSRAVPMDQLLRQAAESLRRSLDLSVVEVWTGSEGRLERTVSVPDATPAVLILSPQEEQVVAREGLSGAARVRVWLPQLLAGRAEVDVRVAPIVHSGRLLGLLVALRSNSGESFRPDDETAMVDLARQMALALHNVELDSALQASVDELRHHAEELRASRARVVAASDAARRAIERDLHDGTQQHLIALGMKLQVAREAALSDPESAALLLDELGRDVTGAVEELRTVAHGIYPPLLAARGLHDALSAAARRVGAATSVDASALPRYPSAVEAAVYFCCLEALQNAGKHAGAAARVSVRVWEEEGGLLFEVSDDGVGFDAASPATAGAGFVNMADRLGAIGGRLSIDSAPGRGTTVSGRIPLTG